MKIVQNLIATKNSNEEQKAKVTVDINPKIEKKLDTTIEFVIDQINKTIDPTENEIPTKKVTYFNDD